MLTTPAGVVLRRYFEEWPSVRGVATDVQEPQAAHYMGLEGRSGSAQLAPLRKSFGGRIRPVQRAKEGGLVDVPAQKSLYPSRYGAHPPGWFSAGAGHNHACARWRTWPLISGAGPLAWM